MPTHTNTDLKSQYADKVTADLEQNTAEQDRIRAELETLQTQLTSLEQDHVLLQSMSAALGDTTMPVPVARRGKKTTAAPAAEKAQKQASGKKPAANTASAKTPAATKKTAEKNAPARTAAEKTAEKTAEKGPALADLIHAHLISQSEPRTAGEIAKALAQAHPGRNVNDNLVRTTTERLVARSRVERAKQGSTVYYTALATGTAAAESAGKTAAASV